VVRDRDEDGRRSCSVCVVDPLLDVTNGFQVREHVGDVTNWVVVVAMNEEMSARALRCNVCTHPAMSILLPSIMRLGNGDFVRTLVDRYSSENKGQDLQEAFSFLRLQVLQSVSRPEEKRKKKRKKKSDREQTVEEGTGNERNETKRTSPSSSVVRPPIPKSAAGQSHTPYGRWQTIPTPAPPRALLPRAKPSTPPSPRAL
jgi:hypothetical protein